MRVFYEDLLREPARVLAKMCELVEVAFDPQMTEPYETNAIETFRAALTVPTTDPKLFWRKKIDASQADKWRTVKLPQPLCGEARDLAQGYGYLLE